LLLGAGRLLTITLVMVAVAITSTGWSAATEMSKAVDATMVETSVGNDDVAAAHGYGSKQATGSVRCEDANAAGCGSSHHQPQNLGQTCCVMTCHTAILSVIYIAPVRFVSWQIKHQQLGDVLEGAATFVLERPPRQTRV
jgi:hypothetical protein